MCHRCDRGREWSRGGRTGWLRRSPYVPRCECKHARSSAPLARAHHVSASLAPRSSQRRRRRTAALTLSWAKHNMGRGYRHRAGSTKFAAQPKVGLDGLVWAGVDVLEKKYCVCPWWTAQRANGVPPVRISSDFSFEALVACGATLICARAFCPSPWQSCTPALFRCGNNGQGPELACCWCWG